MSIRISDRIEIGEARASLTYYSGVWIISTDDYSVSSNDIDSACNLLSDILSETSKPQKQRKYRSKKPHCRH